MTTTMKLLASLLTAGIAVATASLDAIAQTTPYPAKPARLLVGFAAGGPSDVQARLIAREMSPALGQPVIVENRTGAAGVIAFDALVSSAPDGYTLMMLSNTTTTALQAQNRSLEPGTQFVAIGGTHVTPMLLLVNPSKINVRTLTELVGYLKANPGTDFTSSGPGSPGHMGMAYMAKQRGLELTHIAYKGVGPAMSDVMAGRVAIILADSATSKSGIANGLRAVAAIASVRSPAAAEVPTSAEQGFQNFANDSFAGLIAPARTPQAVVERLAAALNRAVNSDAFTGHQRDSGSQARFSDGAAYADALQKDYERWGRVIRETGIKIN